MFGSFGLMMFLPCLMPVPVALFVAVFVMMFGMNAFRPELVLEIGPAEVRLDGWIGTLPRPDSARPR